MKHISRFVLVVLAAGWGCSDVGLGDGDTARNDSASQGEPPSEIVNESGMVLRRRGRAVVTTEPGERHTSGATPEDGTPQPTLDSMSPDELAESLRALTVIDGYEYVSDPDPEAGEEAYVAIHSRTEAARGNTAATMSGGTAGAAASVRGALDGATDRVGQENREHITNTQIYPHSSQIALWYDFVKNGLNKVYGCSATLIGKTTALSAAHCFHKGKGDTWRPDFTWALGPNIEADTYAQQYPYGKHTDGYMAYIPLFFTTVDSSSSKFDFAVIDFAGQNSRGYKPGAQGSYLRWGVFPTTAIDDTPGSIYGYPIPETSLDDWRYPTLRGMSTGAENIELGWFLDLYNVYYDIDTNIGQSGAAFYQNMYGGNTITAIHVGEQTGTENYARMITVDMMVFFMAFSTEKPPPALPN